jgi:hypothetical protein
LYNNILISINKNNMTTFNSLRSIYNFNNINNPLISCFLFLFKGWLSLFVYLVYISSQKQINLLFKLQLLNLIFFKFLGTKDNTENFLFLLLRKTNILQKISLFL